MTDKDLQYQQDCAAQVRDGLDLAGVGATS